MKRRTDWGVGNRLAHALTAGAWVIGGHMDNRQVHVRIRRRMDDLPADGQFAGGCVIRARRMVFLRLRARAARSVALKGRNIV
jgi:hypothetical protein